MGEAEEVDFLFNIQITRVELLNSVQEPEKLDAVVKFAGFSVTVPNNLINASDFDVNQQLTISQSPNNLREALVTKGVVVSLRYDKYSLGNAVVSLPDTFLDKIAPKMNDIFHQETLPLMRRQDSMGTVSLLLVLMVKCELDPFERRSSRRSNRKSRPSIGSEATTLELASPKEECFGLGPTFNPQDVLFVIGDPDPLLKVPAEPCSDLSKEEGDERLMLDLERYRSQNHRVIFPADDPCPRPSFSQLKKLTAEYAEIIDSVAEKVRQVATTELPMVRPKAPPKKPQETGTERWIPVPIESEEEYGVKPIRYCPVCLYSMSWLPKNSPCLRCYTRPRPELKAGRSDMQMTANEIMAEQLVRPKAPNGAENFCRPPCEAANMKAEKKLGLAVDKLQPMVDSDSDAECPPCRCTCQGGKFCGHCRIRKLCEDIFENEETNKEDEYPQPHSSEDFAVIPGPKEDERPYLSRVFSEMKSLYALHDSKKIAAFQKRCQSQTLVTMRSAPSLYQSQPVRFNDHAKESYSRLNAGHKHCLPENSLVSRRHGWDWPRSHQARKYGWRPGAIMRAAMQVMRYFLTSKEDRNPCGQILCKHEEPQQQSSPVLNVCKRDGEIFVTLRPLPNLGMKQKPITFRIVKSDLAVALRQIKQSLKSQGFEKCTCHKSLMMCTCRDALEKFEMNKALRRECRRRLIEPCPEHLVLTDTSVSDLEFNLDVHPPSRSCRSQIKAIRNAVNHGTQTSKVDQLPPPPQYPMQVSPYYRVFDCALGDRYMGTSFGMPGEDVFEDGVFGLQGGGPHGPNPMPCGRTRPANAWGAGGGGGMFTGRGRRQGAPGGGAGGPGGFGGGAWKGIPGGIAGIGGKDGKAGGKSGPIPVRYPKRFLKPALEAAKAAKEAEEAALKKKKQGIDMVKYLQQKGTLSRPWNANDGKDTRSRPASPADKGADGLTEFQRRRRMLMEGPPPLLCQIPRRGKGASDYCRMDIIC